MKRTYLIDSENINDIWVELLQQLEEKDDIMVFYTDKSAHMGYDKIVRLMELKKGTLQWIKCFEGQNALDFQLVTELGHRICLEPKKEYIIVSNDTGYDAVVRYWQLKGSKVCRMKGAECDAQPFEKYPVETRELKPAARAAAKESEKEAVRESKAALRNGNGFGNGNGAKADNRVAAEGSVVSSAEPAAEREAESRSKIVPVVLAEPESDEDWKPRLLEIFRETGSQNPQQELEFLTALCRTVKLSNMSLLHNVLDYHFGQRTGNALYYFIKETPCCRGELSAGYSNNKKQREREYLALVLQRNQLTDWEDNVEAILKIISGIPKKNLNTIHTALVKKFGQEQGGSYYAVIRNHVKILREI